MDAAVTLTFEQLIERQMRNFRTLERHDESVRRIDDEQVSVAALNNRLRLISQIWEMCITTVTHILNKKEDDRHLYFAQGLFELLEEYFLNLNDEILKKVTIIERANSSSQIAFTSSSSQTSTCQYHHVNIIMGHRCQGLIYLNSLSLDNLQRLHFLKSFVEGEALTLLKNIPLTENSFVSAWDRLKNRFENPRAIIQAELKGLFSIQSMKNDSVLSLKTIRNIVTEKISALENLGRFSALTVSPENEIPDGVSDILVFHISQKLDTNTRLAWELKLGNSTKYPHFSELLDFIDSRIRAMEAVQRCDESKLKSDTVRSHVVSNADSCPFCNLAHKLFKCTEFKKNSAEQRFQFVKSKNLCLNCLTKEHSMSNCPSTFSCAHCQSKHHTLLHFKKNLKQNETNLAPVQPSNKESVSKPTVVASVAQSLHAAPGLVESHRILLATAQVIVTSECGRSVKVRALLDQGSTWTFISEELANALQIRPKRSNVQLKGVGDIQVGVPLGVASIGLGSKTSQGPWISSSALILKQITHYVPSINSEILKQPYLQGISLADDDLVNTSESIHILIGADLYGLIIKNGLKKGKINEPIAQNTIFGWVLFANIGKSNSNQPKHFENSDISCLCISNENLNKSIQQFWEIEEVPRVSCLTQMEQECESYFQNTQSRMHDGRYVVRIPFKSGPPINIGSSLKFAEKSLSHLSKNLVKTPQNFKLYTDFMADYENQGHMSRVYEEPTDRLQIVYLPHLPL